MLVLQAMQEPAKASAIAAAMGVSDATVSRMKNERLDEWMLFLAHLGLKVVPSDFKCVSSTTYDFLTSTHARVMRKAPELVWESED